MASTYWIKLYHEILDDPKMGTLPDRLYRRVIELFLLAGKFGDDGDLPDEMQISWVLRVPTDDLLLDLQQLESTGIIERTNTGWKVKHFAERQAPVPDAERKQRQRDREKVEQYHGHVTQMSRNVTQNQNPDTEQEQEEDEKRQELEAANLREKEPVLVAGGGHSLAGSGNKPVENIITVLTRCGIGDPVRSELARLGHVTAEMVEYHCRNAPSIGAAIYRIRNGWEVGQNDFRPRGRPKADTPASTNDRKAMFDAVTER